MGLTNSDSLHPKVRICRPLLVVKVPPQAHNIGYSRISADNSLSPMSRLRADILIIITRKRFKKP